MNVFVRKIGGIYYKVSFAYLKREPIYYTIVKINGIYLSGCVLSKLFIISQLFSEFSSCEIAHTLGNTPFLKPISDLAEMIEIN